MSVLEEQVHLTQIGNLNGQYTAPNASENQSVHVSVPNPKAGRRMAVSNRNNFQQREYDDSFFQQLEVQLSGTGKSHQLS
jgi:hypothetical protein